MAKNEMGNFIVISGILPRRFVGRTEPHSCPRSTPSFSIRLPQDSSGRQDSRTEKNTIRKKMRYEKDVSIWVYHV